MIESVQDLRIFEKVVSLGSLSAAARDMNLSLAVVSKRLQAMEKRLGVRLVQRTTRSQSLTPEGRTFYDRSVRILGEVQDTEALMAGSRGRVGGVLGITAPRSFGRLYLASLVSDFSARHPALSVRLMLADESVDLVEAGIDLAFRFGVLPDSSLVARTVAPNHRVMCAAPAYLARHGMPQALEDLDTGRHACIVCGNNVASRWTVEVDGVPRSVKVRGSFVVNDGEAAQALALSGAGIVWKSIWDVGLEIAAGRLVPVLPQYRMPGEALHLVMPTGRQQAPRVRLFADYAVERLRAVMPAGAEIAPSP